MAAVAQDVTAKTSMASLRQEMAPREANLPIVRAGFESLQSFELLQRGARSLAASTFVPKEFVNNIPNCMIALELAQRIGASPLMVMQNLVVVHGKPTWLAQFVIACINQCGRYTELQFEWGGKEGTDTWSCRAWAKSKATGERVQGPKISIEMAKKEGWYQKSGSKWQSIPELMLMYRAGAWFGRTNAPELTMGLSSTEEARDIIDVEPEPTTLESLREAGGAIEQGSAATVDTSTGEVASVDTSTGEVKEGAERTPEQDAEIIIGYITSATSKEVADESLDLANKLPKALRDKVKKAYDAKWGGA